ncbi:hypothetical protein MXB_2962 [Myxobolus squamalis]|nr:hypothetical protein MXB_2962 [Myxobolus squamalis]
MVLKVRKAIQMDGRILIADEMGLGKTLQALAIASFYRSEWPLLIVCPTSLKNTWLEAVIQWLVSVPRDEIVIIKSSEFTSSNILYITSYETLNCARDAIKKLNFKIIIGDESHNIKNMNSTKTKIFLSFAKTSKRIVLLSGTPLLSRPLELYSQINLICPTLFTNFHKYAFRYCDAKQVILAFNRLKSDVLISIPPKTRKIEFLDESLIETKYIIAKTKVENKNDNSQAILQYYNQSSIAKTNVVWYI